MATFEDFLDGANFFYALKSVSYEPLTKIMASELWEKVTTHKPYDQLLQNQGLSRIFSTKSVSFHEFLVLFPAASHANAALGQRPKRDQRQCVHLEVKAEPLLSRLIATGIRINESDMSLLLGILIDFRTIVGRVHKFIPVVRPTVGHRRQRQ